MSSPPTNQYRVGIVGAGAISRSHAITFSNSPYVAQMLFYDSDTARAKALAGEFGGAATATLEELGEQCDLVWICTPQFVRREPIEMACKAGRAIFCEKPLATTEEDCAFLAEKVRNAGVPFFMGQSGRHAAFFKKMKELVEDGEIGEVVQVWSTRQGYFDPTMTPEWRLSDTQSGGLMTEFGVHELDFIRWIGGDWQNMYARGTSKILGRDDFQDTISAIGTLADGKTARLDVSAAHPRYLWQRGVEGTQGSLFFDDVRVREVALHRVGREPEIFVTDDWQDHTTKENLSFREQATAIFAALQNGTPAPVTLEDGWAAVRAALAVQKSLHSGNVVEIASI